MAKTYTIGETAEMFGVPESTLRFYDKRGLLPFIERDEADRRVFTEMQISLLKTIQHLKNTDMTIGQIKQYVDWIVEGDATIPKRLAMREASLDGVNFKIARYEKYVNEQREKEND